MVAPLFKTLFKKLFRANAYKPIMYILRMGKKGFTLVEIMIVVALIGLISMVAIPTFLKARGKAQVNTCIANLKRIDGAKMLYAIDNNLLTAVSVSMSDIIPDYIKRTPSCPAGGTYTVGVVGGSPACTISGHVLT